MSDDVIELIEELAAAETRAKELEAALQLSRSKERGRGLCDPRLNDAWARVAELEAALLIVRAWIRDGEGSESEAAEAMDAALAGKDSHE